MKSSLFEKGSKVQVNKVKSKELVLQIFVVFLKCTLERRLEGFQHTPQASHLSQMPHNFYFSLFVNFCSHWWLRRCHVGGSLGWFLLFMLLHVGNSLGLLHLCLHMLMWRHDQYIQVSIDTVFSFINVSSHSVSSLFSYFFR